jgi:hypothetical protein
MALAAQRVGQYLETIPDGEPNDPNWVVDTIERMAGRPEVKTLVPPRFYKDPLKPWHGAVYAARRGMKITPETFGLAYAQHAAAALPMLRDINHAAGYFLRLQVDIPGPFDMTAFSFGPLWSRYYDTVVEAVIDAGQSYRRDGRYPPGLSAVNTGRDLPRSSRAGSATKVRSSQDGSATGQLRSYNPARHRMDLASLCRRSARQAVDHTAKPSTAGRSG